MNHSITASIRRRIESWNAWIRLTMTTDQNIIASAAPVRRFAFGEKRPRGFITAIAFVSVCWGTIARGEPISPEAAGPVQRGVQFLKGVAHSSTGPESAGVAAMMALAMIKADVPPTDPDLQSLIKRVLSRFGGTQFQPEKTEGPDIYEAAVAIMALGNYDPASYRAQIEAAANFIVSHQQSNGSWDYYKTRSSGDTSISQYAILGLWEAEIAGVDIRPDIWDTASSWFLSTQKGNGAWVYHPVDQFPSPETVSMTAAGSGSLLICNRQLEPFRKGGKDGLNPLLTPLGPSIKPAAPKYKSSSASGDLLRSARSGVTWIGTMFEPTNESGKQQGPSMYYALYGIERVGSLADTETLGGQNWYRKGLNFLKSSQQSDGSWNATHGKEVNTAWGILFLTRSTKKTVERVKIRRLGAGTLLGGKGLPKDLSKMTIAQGRVVVKPMNGAVDEMLAVLEDPRSQTADSALEGILTRFQTGGPAVLKPYKDRFRAMIKDRDPGVRGVAAWALGRLGDLDAVPSLIDALGDSEDSVVNAAKISLQLLSRKIDGFGPAIPATQEQKDQAIQKWREWYETVRPPALDGQDDLSHSPLRIDMKAVKPPADSP